MGLDFRKRGIGEERERKRIVGTLIKL